MRVRSEQPGVRNDGPARPWSRRSANFSSRLALKAKSRSSISTARNSGPPAFCARSVIGLYVSVDAETKRYRRLGNCVRGVRLIVRFAPEAVGGDRSETLVLSPYDSSATAERSTSRRCGQPTTLEFVVR